MKKTTLAIWLVPMLVLGLSLCSPVAAMAKDENPAHAPKVAKELPRVDVNKASLEELESIKGVGPALAERIIAYRNENGKFKTAQDLTNVKGIGQAKFNRIKDQVII